MSKHLLRNLHQSLFSSPKKTKRRKQRRSHQRILSMESLESRQMLSITTLANLSVSENTGEKPQSKVFEHAGQWWTVMPNSSGTSVFRLDGTSWTATQQITSENNFHADVEVVGDLVHVLLFDDSNSQLATLQYDGLDNRFEPWALRPQLVNVPISSSAETATLEVDSTGRMWVAYDVSSTVEVRYSDGLYTSWSAPITVGSGMSSDDISSIIAMPNNSIGVMYSNQNSDQFVFRVHQDGAAPTAWSAAETAASQWLASVGGNMSDDHVHLATTSDGTLYAAVKTSYTSSSQPLIALLVRRPNGAWDNLYQVDSKGTRPIVVVNEAAGKLIVAYTESDNGGDIVYRESALGTIAFGARQVLISGSNNNVTSTKYTSTNEIVFLAGSSSTARGVRLTFDNVPVNQPPVVSAGLDRSIVFDSSVLLDGSVSDDGLPVAGTLTTSWTIVSGPGAVTFGSISSVDTSASFSLPGAYVLRLTANDGQRSTADEMTVTVSAPVLSQQNQKPVVNAGSDRSIQLGDSALLDGTVSDDGEPTPASLNASWTLVSGPGLVALDNNESVDANASFSEAGDYVFRLTVNDGELSASDEVTVSVAVPSIIKTIVGTDGVVYSLDSRHCVSIDGSSVWENTHDFMLTADGMVYWHSTNGTLYRRSADGSWQCIDFDVVKFDVDNSGKTYALRSDGWVSLNGVPVWAGTVDFALADDDSVYWQGPNGNLYHRPNGGDWTLVESNVTKFVLRDDGAAYSLRTDGWVSVNGATVWERTHDFALTEDESQYWHSIDGSLYVKPSGGDWQLIDADVVQFAIRDDGVVYVLSGDGTVRANGIVENSSVSQINVDEFGRLVLERIGDPAYVVAGQFILGNRLVT